MRYGLAGAEAQTLEEIGRRLGLTRERVRQIELESLPGGRGDCARWNRSTPSRLRPGPPP